MRFFQWLCLATLLVGVSCQSARVATGSAPPPLDSLALLHVNDVYEIAPIRGGQAGGLARVATLRKQIEAEGAPVFTLMAGDFLSPSVIGTVKLDGKRIQGAQMIDVMNAVGFDFAVFGNHEFDLSLSELQARIDESEFDWIAGNVRRAGRDEPQPFRQLGVELPVSHVLTVPRDGAPPLRVGVLSLCLPANPQDYVYYEDVKQSALAQWQDLLPRTDFVVAVTHQTIEQDRELARLLPGLKLIMGGHEHDHHYETVGRVPIAKADANARTAYVHRLTYDRQQGRVRVQSVLVNVDATLDPDPRVARRVATWEARAYPAFQAQGLDLEASVVTLTEPLDGLEAHLRTRQTNLGDALTRAMYQAWDSVACALTNSGSVRLDDYLSGAITQFDLVRTLPFGGQVLRVEMKGQLLARVLAAGQANRGSGGFLQTYRVTQREGRWWIAGQPLQAEQVYAVAISDFLMTGREANLGFLTQEHPDVMEVQLPGAENVGRDIRLALVEYLKNR